MVKVTAGGNISETKRTTKGWVEVILMPLVIAAVGITGTYVLTNEQRNAAEIRAAEERKAVEIRAAADRQIKILELLLDKISSNEEDDRVFGYTMTQALDFELSSKILTALQGTARMKILTSEERKLIKDLNEQAIDMIE